MSIVSSDTVANIGRFSQSNYEVRPGRNIRPVEAKTIRILGSVRSKFAR